MPGRVTLLEVSAESARRLLLDAQGLSRDPARGAQRPRAGRVLGLVEAMGFVQIDSINIVERAHHLTMFSRLEGYRPAMLTELLEDSRQLFEHWTHDASAVPTRWYPHWKPRFERERVRIPQNRWWAERLGADPERVLAETRKRIEREGPLSSRDFERQADVPVPEKGWWGWKPGKAALEHLWRTGELAVVKRLGFEKVYDLSERVFPELHALPAPSEDEHVEWAARTAIERLGVTTPAELTSFWRAISPDEARRWCEAKKASGELIEVLAGTADGSKPRRAFAPAEIEEKLARLEEPAERIRFLSPFDPVLRDRKRAQRLFDFDYRFEAFVPEPQRRYGYYVLPMLEGDRLVGRIDPKLHRDRGVLEVRGVFWERGFARSKERRVRLEEALDRLARFLGAAKVEIAKKRA